MLSALLFAATAAATPFDQIVAAEKGFAADSPVKGLHGAFLAHLAPDSVVFQPRPMPGIAAHTDRPPAKGLLSWGPAWVAAAIAGDLGFSSGPWIYKPQDDATAPRTGWFFTVWRRQPDGSWKARADIGVGCELEYALPASVADGLSDVARSPTLSKKDMAKARARLNAEEARLDREAASGVGAAVLARADDAIRVSREGTCPVSGFEAAGALLRSDARELTCKPDRMELAASGDLGYAYGSCTAATGGATGYLRVWRRQNDGGFKVFVDIVLDVPETK
jgi:ketosteroid isomerase-like protein